ncbi:MAG: tryptophan synthase subunit alpha [Halobacteriales archaeon]
MASERPAVASAFEDGPALIPYVTAGDPDLAATGEYVRALERGGADAIELGMPFSEPIAEGPTIQNAIFRALDAGTTPERFLEMAADLDVDVPLLAMTYYNPIYQYGEREGPEPYVAAAAEAGLSGLIVPDLPAEESDPLQEACEAHGLDLVFIVAPTTAGDRLDALMERTSGFAYVQARLGTTGARSDLSEQTFESLTRLDGYDVPKAVGFGVSEPDHASAIVEGGADGVVVGSALVEIVAEGIEEGSSTAEVADRLERTVAGLKEGAVAAASPEGEHR